MQGYNLYRQLSEKKIIAPIVQTCLMNQTWPKNMVFPDPYYHDSHTDDYAHPSTHAVPGELALFHMLSLERKKLLPKEEQTFTRTFTPMMGSMVHTIIQQKLIHDGWVQPEDVEIALINEEEHWRGHADLMFKGNLIDIKTINSRSFQMLTVAKKSWDYQLHPYMHNLGLKTSMVLAIEVGMPWNMKEIRVDFKQKTLDTIFSKWERVRKAIKEDIPPDSCCDYGDHTYCPIACGGKIPKD